MKKAFLLIVVPALLVALGFAQTPAPAVNTDQTNIKGCLHGSDGNYTVVQDNTGQVFKISTSSVDLKPHLGHDVTLIGHIASEASSTAASSYAVTELNMISEHCAATAAVPAATVTPSAETAVPPAVAATAPAATPATDANTSPAQTPATPAADTAPPAQTGATPAADAAPPAQTPATPAADTAPPAETTAAAPVATVSTASGSASAPAPRARKRPARHAAATSTPAVSAGPEPVSTSAAAATPPAPTANSSTSSEPVSTPAAAATTPAATSRGWSLWLWIAFAVLVIVIGTTFPFLNRWRKRKNLERTGAPNLSFIREASPGQLKSDQDQGKSDKDKDKGKSDPPLTRKAA